MGTRIEIVASWPTKPFSFVPLTRPIAAMILLLRSPGPSPGHRRPGNGDRPAHAPEGPKRQRRGAPHRLFAREAPARRPHAAGRSEEHTSELQSLMRISYAVFCLKKKTQQHQHKHKTREK